VKPAETGVEVQSTNHDASRQLADAIIGELTSRGFDAYRQKDPPFDPNPSPQAHGSMFWRGQMDHRESLS